MSELTVYKNIEYASYDSAGIKKQLLFDLYLPSEGAPRPYPVLIYMHGGGWFENSKDTYRCEVFTQWGYALASINYRLSTEAIFPAMLHNAKAAVRWLRANASAHNLDTTRVGGFGNSSGGHLAAGCSTVWNWRRLQTRLTTPIRRIPLS